jgi:N-ethylmaleimide reductase
MLSSANSGDGLRRYQQGRLGGRVVTASIRAAFKGKYILSGGYDAARADADLDAGHGDLVAFGRPFISNPDLVAKLKSDQALVAPDFATFYTPGEKGYTDY